MEKRYQLSPGSQVREEDFGLLFYTINGPRLYFISSGDLIDSGFFKGAFTLKEWMRRHPQRRAVEDRIEELSQILNRLHEKGVIFEC